MFRSAGQNSSDTVVKIGRNKQDERQIYIEYPFVHNNKIYVHLGFGEIPDNAREHFALFRGKQGDLQVPHNARADGLRLHDGALRQYLRRDFRRERGALR